MVDAKDRLRGDVVFLDEPHLVRAIRAKAPDALIVILPATGIDSIFARNEEPADAPATRTPSRLSRREFDVLIRLATGETNAEIAAALALSSNTVKAYLQSIMRKLGARNRVEAIAHARSAGIIGR